MNKEKIGALKDLSELLEKGNLTKAEYEAVKSSVLRPEGCLPRLTLFARLLTPQLVILILVLLFYAPVRTLIANASEVGFGDVFAVKVEQALRLGNPNLAKVVKDLSREEIATLLNSGSGSYSLVYKDRESEEISPLSRYEHYMSLQEKGLVDSEDNLKELNQIFESKSPSRESFVQDSTLGSLKQKYYSVSDFSPEELSRIEEVSASLSVSGEQVYQLIIGIASEELSSLR